MKTLSNTLRTGMATTLLLAGLSGPSQGEVAGGGASFGPGSEMMMRIRGQVVCTECSLEEVRKTHPYDNTLYQLTHRDGRLVFHVTEVSNAARWERIVWPPQVRVRGESSLIAQLNAEEHLFQEIEITGLLSNARALDLTAVELKG